MLRNLYIISFLSGELPRVISLLNNGSNEETVSMLKVLKGLCTNSKLRVKINTRRNDILC